MKYLKPAIGLASIAALVLSLTPVAYAATITLLPNPNSTSQTIVASTPVSMSSCATPNASAALADTPFLEVPEIAHEMGSSGVSVVEVDLQSNGGLKHSSLDRSSGNVVLDDSALWAARMTKYQPEVQNCRAVSGSYLLEVAF